MEIQETVMTPAPEAEAPETEAPEQEITPETEGDEQPEGQAEDPEVEEIEFNGKKFAVPKELKPAFLMQADYTRKTQEVAESRKAFEQEVQSFQQRTADHQAFLQEVADVSIIGQELAKFDGVDWDTLNATDPAKAQDLWFRYQRTKDLYSEKASELDTKMAERKAQQEREAANLLEKARAELAKPDPASGWPGKLTPELSVKLIDFGVSKGLSREELNSVNNPVAIKILHMAAQWQDHLSKQKQVATAKPAAVPVPQVGGGKSTASISPDRMTPEQFIKWREGDLRKKSSR